MSYKILEANGVDNENIDGGALNNLIVQGKNGIVSGVLSECALTATGSLIGISPGLLILHGIRVKITEMETLTMANAPASATKYQIVAQVVLSADRSVSFSFLVQEPTALKQDELYTTNEGTYQIEFGTFTQNTDGTISNLKRNADDLGQVSEVTKEEFDLAKLEAEGWVTELMLEDVEADLFEVFVTDAANIEYIVGVKVNDELIEPSVSFDEVGNSYLCSVRKPMPKGTIIKVYHKPDSLDTGTLQFFAVLEATGDCPIMHFFKFPKTVNYLLLDQFTRCEAFPKRVKNIELLDLYQATLHIPRGVKMLNLGVANEPAVVYLEDLPDELYMNDVENGSSSYKCVYVPYHLLEEAKAKYPEYATLFDALVPASKVPPKLYHHSISIYYYEDDNSRCHYFKLSFISSKPTSYSSEPNDLNPVGLTEELSCKLMEIGGVPIDWRFLIMDDDNCVIEEYQYIGMLIEAYYGLYDDDNGVEQTSGTITVVRDGDFSDLTASTEDNAYFEVYDDVVEI